MGSSRVHKFLLLAFAIAAVFSGCSRDVSVPPPSSQIVTEPNPGFSHDAFLKHIEKLASDDFEGRAPATPAEPKVIEYIRAEFQAAGLKPGNGDSYYQPVPMVEIAAAPGVTLTVKKGGKSRRFKYADDTVVWTKRVQPEVRIENSELVFVGYGIVAPEYGWNDYAGLDMKGKTAVILINDPGFVTGDPQLFDGKAMTYHGRWTYKFEEAARQGAAGALIVHDTEPAAYGWDVVRSSWSGPQLDKWTEDGNAGRVAIEGWITHDSARAMFEMAGLDLATLEQTAHQRGFKAVPLKTQVSVGVRNTIRRSTSNNVVGILPGNKRPGEYVLYMGHWDHLGRDPEVKGDQIFNGAIDNATGVAALLVLAKAFGTLPAAPERSIVFLATTGEESGLLGSAYYGDHPIYSLAHTAAAINMDALYEGGPTHDLSLIGYGLSDLEVPLREAAAAQGRRVEPNPHPERGSFYRSDHFNLAKQGVPALYVKQGVDAVDGGVEKGAAVHEDYSVHRYHQPSDEYRSDMDFRGALQDLELLFATGYRVAQSIAWPNWYEGKEFRAKRDESSAERLRNEQ